MRADFLPTEDKTYRDNFGIFSEEITEPNSPLVAKYGIADKVAQTATDEADLTADKDAVNSLEASLILARARYDATKARVTANWRNTAKLIKGKPNYSLADGIALKIEGAEINPVWDGKSPILQLKAIPQGIEISYVRGESDGVQLLSQRGTETVATEFKRLTKSKYVDTRPNLDPLQDEIRGYSGFFVVGDEEVGVQSGAVSIVSPKRP